MRKILIISLAVHFAVVMIVGFWICPWLERLSVRIAEHGSQIIHVFMIASHTQNKVEAAVAPVSPSVDKASPLLTEVALSGAPRPAEKQSNAVSDPMPSSVHFEDDSGVAQTLSIQDYMKWVVHHNKPPAYPQTARIRGEQGKVLVRVTVVSSKNTIQNLRQVLEKSSGSELLDKLAMQTVRSWRFPAFLNQDANHSEISFVIPFHFALE